MLVVLAVVGQLCAAPQALATPLADARNPNGRNDAWGFVGAGGGGAMVVHAVSPHNPNTVFVGCDMTGSYVSHDGGGSWRMFNLRGATSFFAFDPRNPKVVYANSIGLFKSSDAGVTWRLIYPTPTNARGYLSKGDHAEEVVLTHDGTISEVLALAVDPAHSRRLYAAIAVDKKTYFYTSADGGEQWRREKELAHEVQSIFIDPRSRASDRSLIFAGSKGFSSRTAGRWTHAGVPDGVTQLTRFSGGFDARSGKTVVYGISGKSFYRPEGDASGIHVSDDGGRTWANRQQGLASLSRPSAGAPEWHAVATSAHHPETVYVAFSKLEREADAQTFGVARSDDFGKRWRLVWTDMITKTGQQTAAGNFGRDWLNERFGPEWAGHPFSIGVSPAHAAVVYTGDYGRTVKSGNAGATWEQVYSRPVGVAGWASRGLDVTTAYSIVFDPFDPRHVLVPTTDIGLMRSQDGGASWLSATKNNGIPAAWVNTTYWLTFDPAVKGRAWAAMSYNHDLPRPKMFRKNGTRDFLGGLVQTDDGGRTWRALTGPNSAVAGDVAGETAMTHILLDPRSPQNRRTLYASAFGKGVYKSVDGGKTWAQKNSGIAGAEIFAWQITRRETDGVLFLVVSRRSEDDSIGTDGDGALYRSDDQAEHWTRVALPEGTNGPTSLAIDPRDPATLVLSAWGRPTPGAFTPDAGGGLFRSTDDGRTWRPTLPRDQHLNAVTVDARNGRMYATGFNGSAYYSQDQGANWTRIRGFNFKWAQRVEPDPRDSEMIFIATFGGGVWHGPAKGDPRAIEDIVVVPAGH